MKLGRNNRHVYVDIGKAFFEIKDEKGKILLFRKLFYFRISLLGAPSVIFSNCIPMSGRNTADCRESKKSGRILGKSFGVLQT